MHKLILFGHPSSGCYSLSGHHSGPDSCVCIGQRKGLWQLIHCTHGIEIHASSDQNYQSHDGLNNTKVMLIG